MAPQSGWNGPAIEDGGESLPWALFRRYVRAYLCPRFSTDGNSSGQRRTLLQSLRHTLGILSDTGAKSWTCFPFRY